MKEFQRVILKNNKYEIDGIVKGNIGYILEIYNKDFCEVEFSDPHGNTIAVQAINVGDFDIIGD